MKKWKDDTIHMIKGEFWVKQARLNNVRLKNRKAFYKAKSERLKKYVRVFLNALILFILCSLHFFSIF